MAAVNAVTAVVPSFIKKKLKALLPLAPIRSDIEVSGEPIPSLVLNCDKGITTVCQPFVVNGVVEPSLFFHGT